MATTKAEKTEKAQKEAEIDIFLSDLVPKHEIITEDEKKQLLNEYSLGEKQLPKIKSTDPAVKKINAKKGDVIRISRKSQTADECFYYRIVV